MDSPPASKHSRLQTTGGSTHEDVSENFDLKQKRFYSSESTQPQYPVRLRKILFSILKIHSTILQLLEPYSSLF